MNLLSSIANMIMHWLFVIQTSRKQRCVCVIRHGLKLRHETHGVLLYCVLNWFTKEVSFILLFLSNEMIF